MGEFIARQFCFEINWPLVDGIGTKLPNFNHANLFISYRSDVEEMFPIKTKVCEHSDECILSHNYWYHIVFYWLLLYYMFLLMIASVKFLSQILSLLFECYRLIFTMHLVSFYILFLLDTLPVKMFGPFWSVWYKTALAEVGVSLPWWCPTLILLAPGYWSLFLNLIIFS